MFQLKSFSWNPSEERGAADAARPRRRDAKHHCRERNKTHPSRQEPLAVQCLFLRRARKQEASDEALAEEREVKQEASDEALAEEREVKQEASDEALAEEREVKQEASDEALTEEREKECVAPWRNCRER